MTNLIKSADLGQGWWANAMDDGSFIIRHFEKGQRINLTETEAARFVELYREAEAEVKAR